MMIKNQAGLKNKLVLSATLRNFLPILESPINELDLYLKKFSDHNPCIEIKSGQEVAFSQEAPQEPKTIEENNHHYYKGYDERYHSTSDAVESLTMYEKTLYEKLQEQITHQLFPTETSRHIAQEIICNLDERGFFEGDMEQIAKICDTDAITVDNIRKRFAHLEPSGVAARNLEESFEFQLEDFEMSDEVYSLLLDMIKDMQKIHKFKKNPNFKTALNIFKKLKNPPAVEYSQNSIDAIPDLLVKDEGGSPKIVLNESFYPDISIAKLKDNMPEEYKNYYKTKLKEAKDLVGAINMRKATLYRIGLTIIDLQDDFFFSGGKIKPMKLEDIAKEISRNSSTISRAIKNKYIGTKYGIIPMKNFFSIAVSDDTSSKAIKDFIRKCIKEEDRKKPLSDEKLLKLIKDHFKNVDLVRRTITKYREQLNMPTSGARKRSYALAD